MKPSSGQIVEVLLIMALNEVTMAAINAAKINPLIPAGTIFAKIQVGFIGF